METLYRENVKIVAHYLFSMCGDEELAKELLLKGCGGNEK